MSVVIGKVGSLDGKFFAKDADGNVVELQLGDEITQDMVVFGDKNNPSDSTINIAMTNSQETITIAGTQEQLFDGSLSEESNLEDLALEEDNIADLVASSDDAESEDETDAGETAAGEETEEGGAQSAIFDARDGGETDVVAGLRDAQFDGAGTTAETIAEPLNAELSIDGMKVVNEGNTATYTLTVTTAPLLDLDVSVEISHIDTNSGDIVTETIVVTIPAGETTGTLTVDNIDNAYAEPDEDYNVAIVGTEGGGYDELTIVNDNVVTTILDETSPDNPEPADLGTTISIAGATATEEGNGVEYTVSATSAVKTAMDVEITISEVSTNGDITPKVITVTIPAGQSEVKFTVDNVDDAIKENPEDYKVAITDNTDGGYEVVGLGNTEVTTTITDESTTNPEDPNNPADLGTTISIAGATATEEGNGVEYTVSATSAVKTAMDVEITI
ncbi:MAG: immunoglobulin-like domain-containing protein, partial [Campylobacterota bacterium]|nr:immunoglobulin-like domain-containing protein [Campylobacterota bacterium]